MKLRTLHDLFVHEIQDLHSAEEQILDALPKLIKKSTHPELVEALSDHLEKTKGHLELVKQVAKQCDIDPKGEKCKGMEGAIVEGDEIVKASETDAVRDAGIIIAAQRVEHYEISGYGSAAAHAKTLGFNEAVKQLNEILDEEYEADEILSELAEEKINEDAEEYKAA